MNRKIYYNLTMLENGWVLKMPKFYDNDKSLSTLDVEEYHATLTSVHEAIHRNFDKVLRFLPKECIALVPQESSPRNRGMK